MARNIQKLPHGCTLQTSTGSEQIAGAFPVPTMREIWQRYASVSPVAMHDPLHARVRSIWDLRTGHVRVSGLTKLFIEQLSRGHDKTDDAIMEAAAEEASETLRLVGITKRSGSELCQGCLERKA